MGRAATMNVLKSAGKAFWLRLETHVPLDVDTTSGEERVSAVSHGIGSILSVVATVMLLALSRSPDIAAKIVGFLVFGITCIGAYAVSATYHALRSPTAKRLFRLLDHLSIYYLIAGTYTPISLTLLHGSWGRLLLYLVWGCALAGTLFKVFYFGRRPVVSVLFYIAMGWLIVLNVPAIAAAAPRGFLLWIFAGGIFYTVGTLIFALRKIPYNHAVWHLFVLAGTTSHVVAMALYIPLYTS